MLGGGSKQDCGCSTVHPLAQLREPQGPLLEVHSERDRLKRPELQPVRDTATDRRRLLDWPEGVSACPEPDNSCRGFGSLLPPDLWICINQAWREWRTYWPPVVNSARGSDLQCQEEVTLEVARRNVSFAAGSPDSMMGRPGFRQLLEAKECWRSAYPRLGDFYVFGENDYWYFDAMTGPMEVFCPGENSYICSQRGVYPPPRMFPTNNCINLPSGFTLPTTPVLPDPPGRVRVECDDIVFRLPETWRNCIFFAMQHARRIAPVLTYVYGAPPRDGSRHAEIVSRDDVFMGATMDAYRTSVEGMSYCGPIPDDVLRAAVESTRLSLPVRFIYTNTYGVRTWEVGWQDQLGIGEIELSVQLRRCRLVGTWG